MDARRIGAAGLVLHAIAGLTLLSVTASAAPTWAVLALACWWLALMVVAASVSRRAPLLTPAVPLIAVAMWSAVMVIGDRCLAWTG